MKKSGINAAVLLAMAGAGLAGCHSSCSDRSGCTPAPVAVQTTGTVVDGYVQGADVVLGGTAKGGVCVGGSHTVKTDAHGNFTVSGVAQGSLSLCAFGGTDITTGLPLVGTLSAPAIATVVSPLTTLVVQYLQSNPTVSPASAATIVAAKLGVPDIILNTDPASPTADTTLSKATQQVQAALATISKQVGSSTGGDPSAIYADALKALVDNLPASGGLAALSSDATLLTSVISSTLSNMTTDRSIPSNVASQAANVNPSTVASTVQSAVQSAGQGSPSDFYAVTGFAANGTAGTISNSGLPLTATTATKISGALNTVSFTLANASSPNAHTAVLFVDSTKKPTLDINVVPVGLGAANSESLDVQLFGVQLTEDPSSGALSASLPSGSVVNVVGATTSGTPFTGKLAGNDPSLAGVFTVTSGNSVNLNVANLLTAFATKLPLTLLPKYDGTTTAGRTYQVTLTVNGLALGASFGATVLPTNQVIATIPFK